jgi:hypothetical protein
MEFRVSASKDTSVMNASQIPLRIAFVGDLALSGEFIAAAKPSGASLLFPFSTLSEELDGIDVFFVNLEGPIGRDGKPRRGVTSHIYNEPEVLELLKRFPVCVCNLANNHVMDYGDGALLRTKNLLAENGIYCVGAGMNDQEASSLLTVDFQGHKLGFLGVTTDEPHVGSVLAEAGSAGCGALGSEEAILKRVSDSARQVDTLIVSIHWGHEYFNYPSPDQVSLGRLLLDSGATIVVGHHPHVPQGVERYGEGLVAHSLGNFLLPELRAISGRIQYRKPITKQYVLLEVEFYGNRVSNYVIQGGKCTRKYELVPFKGKDRERFKAFIEEISNALRLQEYDAFWERYKRRRIQQLQSEDLRDAIGKLLGNDLRVILSTFSIDDLKRNLGRLARSFLRLSQ